MDSETTHFSSIDEIQNKVELVCGLEGVVQSHQEWMLHILQEHVALGHNVFLLKNKQRNKHMNEKKQRLKEDIQLVFFSIILPTFPKDINTETRFPSRLATWPMDRES